MAYNNNIPQAKYIATAGQTVFNYLFKVFQESDLVVYQVPQGSDPEVAVPLILNTDYTVTINGDEGGTIELTSGAAANDAITLYRRLTLNRYVEYQRSGDLLASTLNNDQDYQTYLIADLEDQVTEFLSGDLPGSSSDYVRKIGDTMTGALNLPAGGTGVEAIQAQEVDAKVQEVDDKVTQNTSDIASIDGVDYGIESGSNTNGNYTKFPDGTLICTAEITLLPTDRASGSIFISQDPTEWTFPIAFYSPPSVSASPAGTSYAWASCQVNENRALVRGMRGTTDTTAFNYTVSAIGRWK